LTVNLYQWIKGHLEQQPKLWAIHLLETEVLKNVISMEENGFEVDLEFAKDYAETLIETVAQLEQELKEHFGDINLNSPEQLKQKLFIELKLPDLNKGSVDAQTLNALKTKHKGVAKLLEYREVTKLLNTYILPLQEKISPVDQRLHGQFKQTGTVTGRFSSSDPNLQNIPKTARKLFVAPVGKVLMGMDFSKVEPTILAHMTNDLKFKEPFEKGVDIYSSLASGTFHKPIEECGDGTIERKKMKTGLLATMYGTSMFTLADQLGITIEEAEEFIARFLTNYPVIAKWLDTVHADVDKTGFVETLFGRKRRFTGHPAIAEQFKRVEAKVEKVLGRKVKNIWQEPVPYKLKQEYWKVAGLYFRASRQSVNAIIQGTGADIMKKAMVKVGQVLESMGSDYKMLATVHDEILMEVPETITLEQVEQIEEAMKTCVKLSLPLKVDTEIATRWGEGIPKLKHFGRGK
jgi:DNA polymerase-1